MVRFENMTFEFGGMMLAGTLHLPEGRSISPAIVMIPGSGDSDRDAGDFFPPIRDCFLEQGVAVLSWDKPGCGESTGSWHQQTIPQRAEEASAGIAWLRQHPSIDASRVGFWGQSQGGWIGPMVAAADPDLWVLIIHSGTGVSIQEQDYFGLAETMRQADANEDDIASGRVYMEAIHEAASAAISYEQVRDTILAPARGKPWFDYFGEFSAADWDFFLLNISTEATFDPEFYLNRVTCPTLSIFGEKDSLIPVARSIEILNATVAKSSPDLVIKVFPNGTHRLSPADGSGGFVRGYFEFMREWISGHVEQTTRRQ